MWELFLPHPVVKNASTIRLFSSLVLLPKKFGWILTGNRTGITANEIMDNHISLELLDNNLRRFCYLQTTAIKHNQQKPLTAGNFQIQKFRESYRIEDGRRVNAS
jgi:hypothetical protein